MSDHSAPPRDRSVLSFLPVLSVLPMIQHNGVHSRLVVAANSHVNEGELIGRGQGAGSANIHAPVPGKVVQYINWKMPEKITNDAIVIRLEGTFSLLGKREEEHPWDALSPFALRALMSEYGVIEMDGRGRPLPEVFAADDRDAGRRTLVIRCVFDDPWLAADYCLCRERAAAIAEGAVIAARAAQARQICVAVSSPEKAAGFEILEKLAAFPIPSFLTQVSSTYPQRNTQELTSSLRQFEKKEDTWLGALVFLGPATLAAIYDAVKFRKPVLDRYVAVGGSAVKEPRVLKVRVGTRISDVFRECGGFTSKPKRIAIGSPMMGHAVFSLDEPVVKTTYAVFAVSEETFSERLGFWDDTQVFDLRAAGRTPGRAALKKEDARRYVTAKYCINCGECREVCPAGLDPEDIFKSISGKKHGLSVSHLAMRCHGCGCCEAVCPSNLPLCTTIVNPAFKGD